MLNRRAFLAAASPALVGMGLGATKAFGIDRKPGSATAIVSNFWREVWQKPQNPDAIDRLCTEDFVITTGGKDIVSRAAFKKWVLDFQSKVSDFDLEILEMFENTEGTRVASRLRLTGTNKGLFGPNPAPFVLTVVSIVAVREDGLLEHNWVERNALEVQKVLSGR